MNTVKATAGMTSSATWPPRLNIAGNTRKTAPSAAGATSNPSTNAAPRNRSQTPLGFVIRHESLSAWTES